MKKVRKTHKAHKAQKTQKGKRVGSIQTKLLGIMIPLMAVAILVIMFFSFFSTKENMTSSAYQNLAKESYTNTKVIEAWSSTILSTLDTVKNSLKNVQFISQREEKAFLATTTTLNPSLPNGVYEGNVKGAYVNGTDWVPGDDFVVTESEWYKEGMQNENFAFGDPYIDPQTGKLIVTATASIPERSKMVVAADAFFDGIGKEITNIQVLNCETGYAFLVDTKTNMILAHRDQSLVTTILNPADNNLYMASIAESMQAKAYDVQVLNNNGTPYLTTMEEINGTSWVLVSCVSQEEILRDLHRMQSVYIFLALGIFFVAAIIMGYIIKITVAPVKTLTSGISRIADGDFTVEIAPKGNDEITVMSSALKDYIQKMNMIIREIMSISKQLKEKSEISNATAITLNQTAEVQTQSMMDMKATIDQLAKAVTEVAQDATSLAQVVNITNSKGLEANDNMIKTVDVADKGYKDMQDVQANMQEIVYAIQELAEVVENVGKSTAEINNILSLIEDIASQTNLLSLNATIEAARAGESGRGFAVVADEIGHLADVSSNSTRKIGEIITKINQQVENMVQKTKASVVNIQGNSQAVNSACGIFQVIYEDITKSSALLSSMLEQIRQVDDVASNMAAISEEQSASAQEILATIEILATNSEQIAEESKQVEEEASFVSDTSISLEENMKQFQVKES
ncbi:MAG TPA: methyl-accepting chemotaxis protein [Lachnospiraceae bacterium]|nr:methyl-accepting chemotaxis protein [Lachnospiraceae bacterium]